MQWLAKFGMRLWRQQEGATMMEYGIMVALIAIVVMAAVGPFGEAISSLFGKASTSASS